MSAKLESMGVRALLEVEVGQGSLAPTSVRRCLAWVALGGVAYGACMGSFGLRPLQCLISAIKTPLLISAGGLFCIPSFYVINNLLGLREDFGQALRGIASSQAAVAVCLASLGPITLVLYSGTDQYAFAKALNGVMFLFASLGGQIVLARNYRTLIQRNPRHRVALFAWLTLFWFVTIQLAWMLRPFIGQPNDPTTFLRADSWGNAYVEVWRTIVNSLR
ncbi:MAG: hypothetical protein H6830_06425 [Planctomycetes bacterium]|nr:hypothetical protein [Planctomycetota bacterium]MCB9910940.1 hypothetical protein [Planctomycetota bacterium]MCB9911593.1 hypothetical protein [Planctomycetota bacterium]HPF13066.1 hypothetical protein [Planctomycetota bacterium]HRV81743.1 hypothetical protein [Planctomycetota bacterium]